MERLTQNITTALRFYYRSTVDDAASGSEEECAPSPAGDPGVEERMKFSITSLSSFVEHMEEEEGLELIRCEDSARLLPL